jgi:hypothetical protein
MVVMSTIPGAPNMKVRAGSFVVVAETGDADTTAAQTACQIQHLADGSFQITSVTSGSVGVIALEGPETVFIKAGESVSVTPSRAAFSNHHRRPRHRCATRDQPTTTPNNRKKKVPAGWILLGVVGAGGAGAALLSPDMEAAARPSAHPLRSQLSSCFLHNVFGRDSLSVFLIPLIPRNFKLI